MDYIYIYAGYIDLRYNMNSGSLAENISLCYTSGLL